jgi:hypothetical protein
MIGRAAGILLAVVGGPGQLLAAQGLYYEGGLSVATGRYIFADRTTSWSLTTGVALGGPRLTWRVAWPVYLQNTTLISLAGPGGTVPTGGSASGAVADSGAARKGRGDGRDGGAPMMRVASTRQIVETPASAVTGYQIAVGDPTAQVTWRALDGASTALSASVVVKVPVADTATFGTGEWDVGGTVGASQRLAARTFVGLDAAYWHLGDLETLAFRDVVSGTASLVYLSPSGWGGGVGVSAATASMDGYDGGAWVSAHLSHVAGSGSWSVHGGVGLTETTPDLTLGLAWRVRVPPGL